MARSASAWDPAQYLQFANERLRPARDLLAQTPLSAPARVVDLGCGAGNVTAILQQRFPQAEVVGVDGSVKSLATAPPISRAIATPLGLDRAPREGVCGCWEAVGKWPAGATVESLA